MAEEHDDGAYVIDTVADALLWLDWSARFMHPPHNIVFGGIAKVMRELAYSVEMNALQQERQEAKDADRSVDPDFGTDRKEVDL